MTTLIKPGMDKIVRVLCTHRLEPLHLRELARRTHLFGQSITRYLDQLEHDKYVTVTKEGNQKKYQLRKTKKSFSLLSIFDIERFEKLPEIKKQAIDTYLHSLPQQPIHAILFGSTAKGTDKHSSDIDILIITNEKINTKGAEKEVSALQAQRISTFQMTYTDFKKEVKLREDKVIQSAIGTGYPLINHIRYYEDI